MTPQITVITTTYNSESTVYATMDSVLSQTYPNIQYIISDDCSKQFDLEGIRNYLEANNKGNLQDVVVVQTQQNGGICKNLNFALTFAKGKYIFNLSSDDVFFNDNVLSDWVEEFERTGAQVITASRAVYDKELNNLLYTAPYPREKAIIANSTPEQLFKAMEGSNMVFGSCTAMTKSCLDKFGGYDERYPSIEDYPLNMKILRAGIKIHFWDQPVIKYRDSGVSSCGRLDSVYFKVSDDIFLSEILPYSLDKARAQKMYSQWKRYLSYKSHMANKTHKEKSKANKLIYMISVFAKHPICALRELKLRIGG